MVYFVKCPLTRSGRSPLRVFSEIPFLGHFSLHHRTQFMSDFGLEPITDLFLGTPDMLLGTPVKTPNNC